jgi:UPF0755 protein
MRKKIILLLSLLISFFFLFLILISFSLPLEQNSKTQKIFEIRKGEGAFEIAKNLKKEGLIKSEIPFLIYLILKGKTKNLQAGYYLLSPSMTIEEIVNKFILGEVIEKKVTILEGWDKKEIARYLAEKGILKEEEFLESIKISFWRKRFDFLKEVSTQDVEGFLFPDTYFVKKGEKAEGVVSKMLENFKRKLNQKIPGENKTLKEAIEEKGKSIYDIVIMASLLEKEVKTLEDKKLVSGILWKRLKSRMPLQVDATITFITGKKTIKIKKEDLEIDSPYNTYKYKGLPPTPICNPGFDSILAAVSPQDSNFWYYLTTPEGKTIFSKTLEEHNLAKAKYLK